MAQLQDIANELQTVITTAVSLPAPVAGTINFYTSIQATKKSIVNQLIANKVSLPCVVLRLGKFAVEADFGLDTWSQKRLPVTVHYFTQWGGTNGDQDYVNSQITNISNLIDAPGLTFSTFQALESAELDSDIDEDINAALLASSQVQIVSASASWVPGFMVNTGP